MRLFIRQGVWLSVLVVSCVLAAGCRQEKRVVARGKVTSKGQPLQVKDAGVLGRVAVTFIPTDEEQRVKLGPQPAVVNQDDGTFTVGGPDGRGIPPGRYRIAVYQYDPYPADKLQGQFKESASGVLRDVTGEGEIEIDVSKPGG